MSDKYEEYSREELLRLIRERDRKPNFGLVWERKEIEHERSINNDFVMLNHDPLLSEGTGPHRNLVVEGDNFDALRYLRMTHAGKVKCIYIDPPYNTGNRDFIYNDRFIDKDDVYKHSKWLEFMYRRLVIAKDLLTDDGVIFCSIDDNEMLHLGMLMDQIFGENNRIETLIWKKSYGGGSKAKYIVGLHEYVFCYANNINAIKKMDLPPAQESLNYYKFSDEKLLQRGPYRLQALATKSMDLRPNLRYPINFNGEEIWPEKQWQWSEERTISAIKNNELVITKNKNGWSVNYKQYLKNSNGDERTSKLFSLLDGPYTQEGTAEISDILGDGKAFSFPKPSNLILSLIRFLHEDKNALILDFFAGSGTAAQAVMKLNAADGGSRRYILVSSTEANSDDPNKNICRDVCAERLRRVIKGYSNRKGELVNGLGGEFAYMRTLRIPISKVFSEIQHDQIWRALQLIHDQPLENFDEKIALQITGDLDARVAYLPKLDRSSFERIESIASDGGSITVYSWQPAQLRQRIDKPNVSFEKIPEYLVKRFGGTA